MFRHFCGATLPDAPFCHSCAKSPATTATGAGTRVTAAPTPAPMPVPTPRRQASGKALTVVIGLTLGMVLVTVVVAGAFLWFMNSARSSSDSSENQTLPVQEPQVASLVDTAFTLNAAQGMSWHFNVPANATDVRVEGTFTASGGAGNDVEVYVLDDDEFVNWRNGDTIKALYKSGRKARGTLNTVLPAGAGTYHLVFNNKFSLSTPKEVTASIRLRYAL